MLHLAKSHQGILLLLAFLQTDFCLTSEAGGGIGGRLQSYAGLDGDMYLRGGGGPDATGVLNTGACHYAFCCCYLGQPHMVCSSILRPLH
jgi:hypothetical protein